MLWPNWKWVSRVSGANKVSSWARVAGVPLLPFSGTSPVALIIRGLIHLGICGALAYGFVRMRRSDSVLEGMGTDAVSFLDALLVPAIIVAVLLALYALLRIVVGALDLVPRQTVHGTVVSLRQRKMGDFLPRLLQQRIWERGEHSGYDRRRTRTELVLATGEGTRRWTVRNRRLDSTLAIGRPVTIRVSPLVGYVAEASRR